MKEYIHIHRRRIYWVLLLVSVIFLIAAMLVPLAPGLVCTHSGKTKYYGSAFAFIFGGKVSSSGQSYTANGKTLYGFIGYLCFIAAAVFTASSPLLSIQYKKIGKLSFYLSGLLLLVGGILFFFVRKECAHIVAEDLYISPSTTLETSVYTKSYLGVGFLLSSIFAFIGAFFYLISFLWELIILKNKTTERLESPSTENKEPDYSSVLQDDSHSLPTKKKHH